MAFPLKRYIHIFRILIKYGFEDVVGWSSIGKLYLKITSKPTIPRAIRKQARWVRIRKLFEELGTTYIKFGQMLSNRPGLLPDGLLLELAKLQDAVPPFEYADVKKTIYEELGGDPEEVFVTFGKIPIASASIGQVHLATLPTGEEVVVKVQRPGLVEIIQKDILILKHFAQLAAKYGKELALLRPVELVEAFEQSIFSELDFLQEANNCKRFAQNFKGNPKVLVPTVYDDYSNVKVVTMSFIKGIKISNLEALREANYDLYEIATVGFGLFYQQFFEHGFFHADPHPGNLFVTEDKQIGFIDFGMMGYIAQEEKQLLSQLVIALWRSSYEELVDAIEGLSSAKIEDKKSLEREIQLYMDQYGNMPVSNINLGRLLEDIRETVNKHSIQLNPDLFLLLRTISMLEGLGMTLDPTFNSLDTLKPYAVNLIKDKLGLSGDFSTKQLLVYALDALKIAKELPESLYEIIKKVRDGEIVIKQELNYSKEYASFFEKQIQKLILTALCITFVVCGVCVNPSNYHIAGILLPIQYVLLGIGASLLGVLLFQYSPKTKK